MAGMTFKDETAGEFTALDSKRSSVRYADFADM
jgi:hypothetical protein